MNRVVLADDHKPFREALRNLLARDPEIEVVGEAGDGSEALRLVRSMQPDVIVMDLRMPSVDGITVLRQLAAGNPATKVIVVSVDSEPYFAKEMLAAGASGYVTKADADELPRAIRAVAGNMNYLSNEVAGKAAVTGSASDPKPLS